MGGAGEDFREKPRLDNVQQQWGRWVYQLSRFDSCKTLFRRHGIWGIWGFRSYQMCCGLGCMDAKLTIPVMGGAGEDFREKPRLDNVLRGVLQFAAGSIAAKPVEGELGGGD